jgi:hypothetical protein
MRCDSVFYLAVRKQKGQKVFKNFKINAPASSLCKASRREKKEDCELNKYYL